MQSYSYIQLHLQKQEKNEESQINTISTLSVVVRGRMGKKIAVYRESRRNQGGNLFFLATTGRLWYTANKS